MAEVILIDVPTRELIVIATAYVAIKEAGVFYRDANGCLVFVPHHLVESVKFDKEPPRRND